MSGETSPLEGKSLLGSNLMIPESDSADEAYAASTGFVLLAYRDKSLYAATRCGRGGVVL